MLHVQSAHEIRSVSYVFKDTDLSSTGGAISRWNGREQRERRLPKERRTPLQDSLRQARHHRPHRFVSPAEYLFEARSALQDRGSGQGAPRGVDLDSHLQGLERAAIDRLGSLWVGTIGGGVARISASGFSSFS